MKTVENEKSLEVAVAWTQNVENLRNASLLRGKVLQKLLCFLSAIGLQKLLLLQGKVTAHR